MYIKNNNSNYNNNTNMKSRKNHLNINSSSHSKVVFKTITAALMLLSSISSTYSISLTAGQHQRRYQGIGQNSMVRRCYTVCPPVVYPTGHDPYYESSYFTAEKELHGGPFGPHTLNPYSPNQPMNFAGKWPDVKNPVPSRALPSAMPMSYNPYNPTYANSFLQLGISTKNSIATKVAPRGAMCLHVCPQHARGRADVESFGGPFGPDPYYSKSKMMFVNKNGQSGFSSPAAKFRNHHNEPYGGPFGADPYYVYGQQHQDSGGVHDGYVPARL